MFDFECFDEFEQRHSSTNKPAVLRFDKDGRLVEAGWYSHGLLHRNDDCPAEIRFSNNDSMIHCLWYVEGNPYRGDDKASIIAFTGNHVIREEIWFNSFYYHYRVQGPAQIYYDENGKLVKEKYYLGGSKELTYEEWKSSEEVKKYYRFLKNEAQGIITSEISF